MSLATHALSQRTSDHSQASTPTSRLTELIVPSAEHHAILLPMIQYLSNQQEARWLTIISDKPVSQLWLRNHGVNPKAIRVIQANNAHDALWMTWEAVANGTSHTVMAELGLQTSAAIKELERAAGQGSCRVLLVRSR